jgi:hypothetical protein
VVGKEVRRPRLLRVDEAGIAVLLVDRPVHGEQILGLESGQLGHRALVRVGLDVSRTALHQRPLQDLVGRAGRHLEGDLREQLVPALLQRLDLRLLGRGVENGRALLLGRLVETLDVVVPRLTLRLHDDVVRAAIGGTARLRAAAPAPCREEGHSSQQSSH